MSSFHEVRFPTDVSLKSKGGPQRRTDIVTLGSGREERNTRWHQSRRRYDAGYGIKSLADLNAVVAFFEERRGRLHGFRWHDRTDDRSGAVAQAVSPLDQGIGTGDGAAAQFQLVKTYGVGLDPYRRAIRKPVAGSVRIALDGQEIVDATIWSVDCATGLVTFAPGHLPRAGAAVTAGFLFDVPVRFDTDYLELNLASLNAGEIPHIPIVEIIV